jgi:hypothetical protein
MTKKITCDSSLFEIALAYGFGKLHVSAKACGLCFLVVLSLQMEVMRACLPQ